MSPRSAEVLMYLDTTRGTLERTLAEVPSELREQRPSPESWSIAQVIQHLALTEGRVTGMLAGFLERARESGVAARTETPPLADSFDLARVLDRSRSVAAGEAVLPREPLDTAAAWERLEDSRAKLRELILSAHGDALANVSAPHRVLGTIDGYQWVLFIGAHEARHTAQIREICDRLRK
jgi:hypothetical protein